MVFRRGLALMCIAAAVALVDVTVDAKEHHHHKQQQVALKESKIEYPNGHVLISSSDNAAKPADDKKHAKKHTKHAKKADDDDSSDDVAKHHKKHHKKQSKKVEETTAANGEVTRKYAHGSVRIFKQPSSGAAATAKGNKQVHTHAKGVSGDVTKDFALTEGVNTFAIEGVPLQVTLDHGKVDVRVNGQHVETGGEITVEAPTAAKAVKAAAVQKPEEVTVAAPAGQNKAAVDDKAERVTALATKLETTTNSNSSRGIFETTPVMIICGVIGALAAVVGVAAVAVTRSRTGAASAEDANLQSVLADASEADLEAATEDAPADQTDSLEDSSDDDEEDDDEAGEGTFANNEGTVSV